MHFQFRIKRYVARTDSEIHNSKKFQQKQIRDKHPGDWLYRVRERKQKGKEETVKGGISFSAGRPDAA